MLEFFGGLITSKKRENCTFLVPIHYDELDSFSDIPKVEYTKMNSIKRKSEEILRTFKP